MSITPLEQFSNPLLLLPIPMISIGITKLTLYGTLALVIVFGFYLLPITSSVAFVGSRWTIATESLYSSVSSILKDQLGESHSEYLPSAMGIFTFILFANFISNVPYSFSVTSSAVVCLGLSVTIFLGVTILGLSIHGIKWFSFFIPSNSPIALVPTLAIIELISYVARAFSLGVRLFANILAGHILLAVLSSMIWGVMTSGLLYFVMGLMPFAIFTALFGLELAVGLIQAYVFTLLYSSYINDAINLH